jgi:glycosyltransferase involved in cell wall biosynthesis
MTTGYPPSQGWVLQQESPKPDPSIPAAPRDVRGGVIGWRILMDTRSPWLVEFARALAETVPARAFSPEISLWGRFKNDAVSPVTSGAFSLVRFPLQRGYFSRYLSPLVAEDRRILSHLKTDEESGSQPLVCCLPHYARVAEQWPGPVVYYATDLFRAYSGWNPDHLSALERRICQTATLVCPNSTRVADILVRDSGCDPNRILVLPNAVRHENLLPEPAFCPAPLPPCIEDLQRPVAGVIGNLAENTDWELTEQAVLATPWLSWLFVGPYSAPIKEAKQADARLRLLGVGGRVRFVGPKDYGDLMNYARALDVAILPYRKREPTYSGSSTRFYEHLAACRPMIASDGFEELLHKAPLVQIARSPHQMTAALEQLRSTGFRDGWEEERWQMSIQNTWQARARQMCDAILFGINHSGAVTEVSSHA